MSPSPRGCAAPVFAPNRGRDPSNPPTVALRDSEWSPSPPPPLLTPAPSPAVPPLPSPAFLRSQPCSSLLPSQPGQGTAAAHGDSSVAPLGSVGGTRPGTARPRCRAEPAGPRAGTCVGAAVAGAGPLSPACDTATGPNTAPGVTACVFVPWGGTQAADATPVPCRAAPPLVPRHRAAFAGRETEARVAPWHCGHG